MTRRASEKATLEFCQKVRAVGGGDPIDALVPGVPGRASSCLIANSLNFECEVMPAYIGWAMYVDDAGLRDRLARALHLRVAPTNEDGDVGVYLPKPIGQVAGDFDYCIGWPSKYVEARPEGAQS